MTHHKATLYRASTRPPIFNNKTSCIVQFYCVCFLLLYAEQSSDINSIPSFSASFCAFGTSSLFSQQPATPMTDFVVVSCSLHLLVHNHRTATFGYSEVAWRKGYRKQITHLCENTQRDVVQKLVLARQRSQIKRNIPHMTLSLFANPAVNA